MKSVRGYWALILLVFVAFTSACSREKESVTDADRQIKTARAEVAEAIRAELPEYRAFPAVTEAKVSVTLSAKIPGYVKKVLVEEGQQVKKGQLLLVVDQKDIQSKLKALEAAKKAALSQKSALEARLSYAKTNFQRFERLMKDEAATQEEYDRAESEYLALKDQVAALSSQIRQIEAQMIEARNQLSYVRISAPVNGWITERLVDPGTYVNPGVPLIQMEAQHRGFWLKAGVDESLVETVEPGTPVRVSIPALNMDFESTLAATIPKVDPSTHTFDVKVELKGERLKSGLFGRLFVRTAMRKGLVIPAAAIIKRGAIDGVFIVDSSHILRWRLIKVGSTWIRDDNGRFLGPAGDEPADGQGDLLFVEVLSGLEPGDTVAVSNLDALEEGMRLE